MEKRIVCRVGAEEVIEVRDENIITYRVGAEEVIEGGDEEASAAEEEIHREGWPHRWYCFSTIRR